MKTKNEISDMINQLQHRWGFIDEGLTNLLVEAISVELKKTFQEGFDKGFREGQDLPF